MAMYPQISYWSFRDSGSGERNVVEAMRLAKEAGFGGIELAIGERGALTPATPANECRNLAAAAKAIGIKIGSVTSGLLWETNPASKDKAVREQALETTKQCLRVTADLGAKHLVILTGHVDVFFMPKGEVVPYGDCYDRSLAFCKAVGKEALKRGVTACVKNVWNRFLLSPLEFAEFIGEVKSKGVGVCLDVGNVWNTGYPQQWIGALGKKIQRVIVKDFRRAVGNANGFCQLLEGDVPLKASIKLLKKLKYNGPITAEVFPGRNDLDEKAFLRDTYERLKSVM